MLDGLGAGKESNGLMQSQRNEKNKNTEVEIPIEVNKSQRVGENRFDSL